MEKENVTARQETVEQLEVVVEKQEKAFNEQVDEFEKTIKESKEVSEEFDKVNEDQEALRIELEQKEKELFQKEVAMSLAEHKLEAFKDVIHVKDSEHLQDVVAKLTGIVNDIKIGAGYVPRENAKQAEYETAKQNKDVKSMIGSKLANFFNK